LRRRRKAAFGLILLSIAYAAVRGRVRRYEIVERSMRPTLEPGDYVVAVPHGDYLRGQIVVFPGPSGDGFELVKRVVGLPGENVVISNGQVHINGAILPERWANGPTWPDGEWQLTDSEVFLLGDNRPLSTSDSRTLGPIRIDAIGWRVVARYWPPLKMGRITNEA